MKIDNPTLIGQSTGFGVPTGGSASQVLTKINSTNYNATWSTVYGLPSGGTDGQVLVKTGATAGLATWTSVINDNSSSNYIDIANVRYQWGTTSTGGTGARTLTLPAAFGNTSYSVTANVTGIADSSARTVNIDTQTTTSIVVRVTAGGNGSGAAFNWIAIGLKP
jgi:hypothetical protein